MTFSSFFLDFSESATEYKIVTHHCAVAEPKLFSDQIPPPLRVFALGVVPCGSLFPVNLKKVRFALCVLMPKTRYVPLLGGVCMRLLVRHKVSPPRKRSEFWCFLRLLSVFLYEVFRFMKSKYAP